MHFIPVTKIFRFSVPVTYSLVQPNITTFFTAQFDLASFSNLQVSNKHRHYLEHLVQSQEDNTAQIWKMANIFSSSLYLWRFSPLR